MEQISTTTSSDGDAASVRESSARSSSVPPTPVETSDTNNVEKKLPSVSESECCMDVEHDEFDQTYLSGLFASTEEKSEVGLFGTDQDDPCEYSKNSTFLVTGTSDADIEHREQGGSDTSRREGEAEAGLTWTRTVIKNENNDLVEACEIGDVDVVRKLLNEGRSVQEMSEKGVCLLSIACSAGHQELVTLFLEMRAEIEDRGVKGDCTPLMEAASSGFVDIVRLLLSKKAAVNALSMTASTPLMFACAGRDHHLYYGADEQAHDENERRTPSEAESEERVMVVKILIEYGADINHFNEFKESALTLACYKGHIETARVLLSAGADLDHETDIRRTALMEASSAGHIGVARLLLDSGAKINKTRNGYQSPLTLAATYGHAELALFLIDNGAYIEEIDMEFYTPLMLAAQEGHKDMVIVLLDKGANINVLCEDTDETALSLACYGGYFDIAKLLIENGAMLELGSPTPLMEAAEQGHIDLVRYLLECGANVHAPADTDSTFEFKNLRPDVADLLLQFGFTM